MINNNRKTEISCAFTGHRMEKLPWRGDETDPGCIMLKKKLADAVEAAYSAGKRHFLCGMATGCDMYFCEAVIELRACKDDITLEAAIPCEGQANSWDELTQKRYYRLVSECDYQTVVQQHYTPDCMMRRNRYMVDNASMLIACYDGMPGGTQSTMLYAMRKGVEILELRL